MKTSLIIYATTSGNTEHMANMIGEVLKKAGFEVTIKDVTDAEIAELTGPQDLTLLGCPSYGVDEIELQEDFAIFYDQMENIDLSGKKYAVFAPGDSSHEFFCGAAGKIEEKVKELGANVVIETLKVDGDPDDFVNDIKGWANRLSS